MLETPTPDNSGLIVTVIGSIITNIAFAVKYLLDLKTQKTKIKSDANITAYDQLSALFKTLREQLEKLELRDAQKDTEIENLENCLEDMQEKAKKARLDLLDLNQSVKDIRRFLRMHEINDQDILNTLEEVETQLTTIGDCLK